MKHGYGFFSQFFDPDVARQHRRRGFEMNFDREWRRAWKGQFRRGARRGEIRSLVLEALKDGPRHGYDIMTAIEESRGFRPSPGSIYPTLQMLEDGGFVTSAERDGKRVYTLTEAGRALLEQRAAEDDDEEDDEDDEPDARDRLRASAMKLGAAVMGARGLDDEAVDRIREILDEARKEVYEVLSEA